MTNTTIITIITTIMQSVTMSQESTNLVEDDDATGACCCCCLVIANIQKRANLKQLLILAAAFACDRVFVVGQPKFREIVLPPGFVVIGNESIIGKESGSSSSSSRRQPPKTDPDEDDPKIVIIHLERWDQLIQQLQKEKILLVGIEINPSSMALEEWLESLVVVGKHQQHRLAFLMGNESLGIIPKYLKSCQVLVRIPLHQCTTTASLNVYVAASIVLQRFHQWQRKQQQQPQRVLLEQQEG